MAAITLVLIVFALITMNSFSVTQALIRQPTVLEEAPHRHQVAEEKKKKEEGIWADMPVGVECNLNYIENKRKAMEEDDEHKDARRLAEEEEEEDEEEEFNRQIHLEKLKRDFLQRLHMSEPPNFSWPGGLANRTQGRRILRSLPLALQGRILSRLRAEDGATEPLLDRADERETLILLKPLKWKLPKVASATFGIEVADDIDASRIYSALLQFETNNPVLKGQRLEVWEVFLTSEEAKMKKAEGEEDEYADDANEAEEQYNNLTRLFEQQSSDYTSLPVPTQLREPLDVTTEQIQHGSIRIRPNLLAETFVLNRPRLVQVTFEISATFSQWMSHKRRKPLMQKLIRSILVVCPKCEGHLEPVDVKKGILEIRHRNSVRRSRRSLNSNHRHQVTIENQCESKGPKFSCCTQSLTLNLEKAGWSNWIVHPKTVQPNYCRGSCQTDDIRKATHFSLMHLYQNQFSNQLSKVEKEAMLSCCHPVKMASASVLYLNPNTGIHMTTLHNFIVVGCGCS